MSITNNHLHKPKRYINDEFYTCLTDIEEELCHYIDYFEQKVIYLNCDDPANSNFWIYFRDNFHNLRLKKLIATYYGNDNIVYQTELSDNIVRATPLEGNGDFRSEECVELLKEADIVVTNPPFSLLKEYIPLCIRYCDMIVLGNVNVITYQSVFALIKDNKLWPGYSFNKTFMFKTPSDTDKKMPGICWFTNLPVKKNNEFIPLSKKYNEADYPKYDNYDAINVDRVVNIPYDYQGIMGVPVTFIGKYNPKQFEITGMMATTTVNEYNFGYPYVGGKKKYARLLVMLKNSII